MEQLNVDTVTCFKWCFTKKPGILNYMICETKQECCKSIEKQYRCKDTDYKVLARQERIFSENKSEVIREEAYG